MTILYFRHAVIVTLLWCTAVAGAAQTAPLTLENCYTLAEQHYPMTQQRELIAKSSTYTIDNISKGVWPQLSINGQATYQSDVTKIPISIPGMNIQPISKGQYKLYAEVNQPLTDMITVQQQKSLQEVNAVVQKENLEVDLYKLKDRVNQLFFGILLIDAQIRQNELLKADIQTGINKISAAVTNGVELKSSVDKLKAELLKAGQRDVELKASRKAYLDMLGLFINQTLDESTQLQTPEKPAMTEGIKRPEVQVFDLREKSYAIQHKLIKTKNLPKFSLFLQGGMGQPSPVNMLSRELSTYYIGGLRLNWSLTGFYTYKKEQQLIDIDRMMLNTQKETFLFNTTMTLKQQNGEMVKLQQLLTTDDDIIALRTSIKNTASVQLENGVITANDFLKEINAEDQARQSKLLHEIQLLIAQYNYQNTSGTN